jgi:hypothetical protein
MPGIKSSASLEPGAGPKGFSAGDATASSTMEEAMSDSDPHFPDPRNKIPQWGDPYDPGSVGPWGWVAGLVAVGVIALILVVADRGANQTSASNTPPASSTSSPLGKITPQGTTGMGSPQQFPSQRRPATGGNQ